MSLPAIWSSALHALHQLEKQFDFLPSSKVCISNLAPSMWLSLSHVCLFGGVPWIVVLLKYEIAVMFQWCYTLQKMFGYNFYIFWCILIVSFLVRHYTKKTYSHFHCRIWLGMVFSAMYSVPVSLHYSNHTQPISAVEVWRYWVIFRIMA